MLALSPSLQTLPPAFCCDGGEVCSPGSLRGLQSSASVSLPPNHFRLSKAFGEGPKKKKKAIKSECSNAISLEFSGDGEASACWETGLRNPGGRGGEAGEGTRWVGQWGRPRGHRDQGSFRPARTAGEGPGQSSLLKYGLCAPQSPTCLEASPPPPLGLRAWYKEDRRALEWESERPGF